MSPPLSLWAVAFVVTCALEIPIVVWATRHSLGLRAVGVAFLLQVCTHPALWYVVPQFEPYLMWVAVAELGVTAVEALMLGGVLVAVGKPDWPRAVGAVVVANTVSTTAGLVWW